MLTQEFRPDRLSTARRQEHLTQKALAETVGVSENFLIGMKKGRKRPSMKTAEKLATALRCPISSTEAFEGFVEVFFYPRNAKSAAPSEGAALEMPGLTGGQRLQLDALTRRIDWNAPAVVED